MCGKSPRRGLTLTEVSIASLLVGVMAIGAMRSVGVAARTRATIVKGLNGSGLAEQLLSEVLRAKYEDPDEAGAPLGTDTGEAAPRANFDDVDDYQNWDASPPVDSAGVLVPGYTGWRREVFVKYVVPGTLANSGSDTGLKHVQVRVTDPRGKQTEIFALRTRGGASDQAPPLDDNFTTWAGCELQIGSETAVAVTGANLVNRASDR